MKTLTSQKLRIDKVESYKNLFTDGALEFLIALHENFNERRLHLLENRELEQKRFNQGFLPNFLTETEPIRKANWTAAPLPEKLLDRRVEITGPTDRKMMINALNSGAKTFMADLEDSTSPSWENLLQGQINLIDAVNGTISYEDKNSGKVYQLNEKTAVLLVRPRGLHLNEKHFVYNSQQIAGSLFDFGLFMYHNAHKLSSQQSGPYFYLPKLEHYLEARWWNDVFIFSQNYLGIPLGTIKATVLIETITASFQLDEIIYELKEHIAGLNCGRWDYIFSYIKKFRNHVNKILPDRSQVTMQSPFMEAYSLAVIQTCHKRNISAIGGMAAQIPVKNNPQANEIAFQKVRQDKEREVKNGHDGTWVAHPGLVPIAMEIFDTFMPTPNQIHLKREDVETTAEKLLESPKGTITEKGFRENIHVGILYVESWLSGKGAAALFNLMEDAATAEISRTQLWQWLHMGASLEDGRLITSEFYKKIRSEEVEKIRQNLGKEAFQKGKFTLAIELFDQLVLNKNFDEFLTITAYPYI